MPFALIILEFLYFVFFLMVANYIFILLRLKTLEVRKNPNRVVTVANFQALQTASQR